MSSTLNSMFVDDNTWHKEEKLVEVAKYNSDAYNENLMCINIYMFTILQGSFKKFCYTHNIR